MNCAEYVGMTPREALRAFSGEYFKEGDTTENGVIAKAILDYLEEIVSHHIVNNFYEINT